MRGGRVDRITVEGSSSIAAAWRPGRSRWAACAALVFLASACTAGDPLGLYHPYHEHHASEAERGAAFAAHQVTYGSHESCGRKLAQVVAEGEDGPAADPVRLSSNELIGYRRFGADGEAVIQEYRCIDNYMHFRAWVEPSATH